MKTLHAVVTFTFALLVACSKAGGPVDAWDDSRTVLSHWQARDWTDYQFDFERQCFCIRIAVEPVTIVVRHGAIESVRSRATGEELAITEATPWYTIEDLFRLIQAAERADTRPLIVKYHPLGYPSLIELGTLASDAGVRYTVANVTAIH